MPCEGCSVVQSGGVFGSSRALLGRTGILERKRQHFIDRFDEIDAQRVANFLRDIGQILFVVLRQNNRVDAEAMSRQQFLLDAANRQHPAAQSDLAGHRDVLANRHARQRRSHRSCHRDAGRWAVFGNRSFGNVNVQVALANKVEAHSQAFSARLDASQRRLRGFLHHVAKFAGQRHPAAAFGQRRFDLQNFAADFGPGQAGGQSDFAFRGDALLTKLDRAEHLAERVRHRRCP